MCGGSPAKGLMIQINRAYLDVRAHLDVEDYPALAEDGTRIVELAERIRPLNPAADYQQYTDALRDMGREVRRAGQAEDMAAGQAAFVALSRPCADCHRLYREQTR